MFWINQAGLYILQLPLKPSVKQLNTNHKIKIQIKFEAQFILLTLRVLKY